MTMPPAKTINPASEKQKIVRERFRLAAGYARLAMENPEIKAIYAARATKNMAAYRLAVQDFLSPPFIRQIDTSGYKGNPGDTILVAAGDSFRVTRVMVTIRGADGNTIEEGACTLNLPTGKFEYAATASVPVPAGCTLTAKVTDLPGNCVEQTVTL